MLDVFDKCHRLKCRIIPGVDVPDTQLSLTLSLTQITLLPAYGESATAFGPGLGQTRESWEAQGWTGGPYHPTATWPSLPMAYGPPMTTHCTTTTPPPPPPTRSPSSLIPHLSPSSSTHKLIHPSPPSSSFLSSSLLSDHTTSLDLHNQALCIQ